MNDVEQLVDGPKCDCPNDCDEVTYSQVCFHYKRTTHFGIRTLYFVISIPHPGDLEIIVVYSLCRKYHKVILYHILACWKKRSRGMERESKDLPYFLRERLALLILTSFFDKLISMCRLINGV